MKDWKYGEDGRRFPVQRDEVWQVGDHLLACADLMSQSGHAVARDLVARVRPTLVYTDPPWGQGNLNTFRTKAALQHAEHTYLDLYERIATLVAPATPLWMETGRREESKVVDLLAKHRPVTASYAVTYYKRNPSRLIYAGQTKPPAAIHVAGLDDDDTPGEVMAGYPRGVVLDPCMGRGLIATVAHKKGWRAIGTELSPWRLSVTLSKMARLLNEQPRRVS